jgi:hypothetical protein
MIDWRSHLIVYDLNDPETFVAPLCWLALHPLTLGYYGYAINMGWTNNDQTSLTNLIA